MKRYECLPLLAERLPEDALVVTSLGAVIAEWESIAPREGNFYTYHSMGLASSIACGLALALPHRKVVCLDGDGSLFMNLSSLATLGALQPANLDLFVFDNKIYEATGGQPTRSRTADLAQIGRACGITSTYDVADLEGFRAALSCLDRSAGPNLVVVRIEPGTADVPIPTMDPRENKYRFVRYVERTEGVQILPPYFI